MKYRLYAVVLVAWCAGGRAPAGPALRVYNGAPDTAGKYPYVVLLTDQRNRFCTGTLVTEIWALTAAHCIVRMPQVSHISYGNISGQAVVGEKFSRIKLAIAHPRYHDHFLTRSATGNDIALLQVDPPVSMKAYGEVSAVDYKTLTGLNVEYAGYGMHSVTDPDSRGELLIGEGIVKPSRSFAKRYPVLKSYVCVAPRCSQPQVAMSGDSGGPMFLDNKIVAVHSLGNYEHLEMCMIPVSPHLSWIQKVITGVL